MPTIAYKLKDGTQVSGTTTIISQNLGWNKQALMYWANQVGQDGKSHRDVSKEAADAGTCCHYLIDCHIKRIEPDLSTFTPDNINKAETGFLNFLEWEKMVDLRTVATEVNLVSEKYRYGATPDLIGTVVDKLALIDWKTSNGVYSDYLLQLAAYRVAWEEVHPEQPLEGGFHLLRISKEDAAFHHHHWGSLPEAWDAFECLLKLHKLQKILSKKV